MIEGVGPWRNFDEIEESLILDELLLLHEVLGKSKHANYRMLASFQGIDLGDIEETGADDLPEEVLSPPCSFTLPNNSLIFSLISLISAHLSS